MTLKGLWERASLEEAGKEVALEVVRERGMALERLGREWRGRT